ncbi:MAG: hypothetical protein QXN37_00075 [Candidatus Anstonellaceae archaeon]
MAIGDFMQMNEMRGVHKSPLPRSESALRRKFKEAFERTKSKLKLGLLGASIVAMTFFSPNFNSYQIDMGPAKTYAQDVQKKPYKPKYKCEIRGYPYFDVELNNGELTMHNYYYKGEYRYGKVDLLETMGEKYNNEKKEEVKKLRDEQIRMILYARVKEVGEVAYLIFDYSVLAVLVTTKTPDGEPRIGMSYNRTPDKSRILLGKDQIGVTEDGYLFATSRTAVIGFDEGGVASVLYEKVSGGVPLELENPKFEVDRDNPNFLYVRDKNMPEWMSIGVKLGVK